MYPTPLDDSWWTELHEGVEAALRYFSCWLLSAIPTTSIGTRVISTVKVRYFILKVDVGNPLVASCLVPPPPPVHLYWKSHGDHEKN